MDWTVKMTNGQNLRVIAGKLKGKVLLSPGSSQTHPMGSREKLALFNMLQPWLENTNVLDVYAGSGALGIEALSRGAREVSFIEKDRQALQVIKENLTKTEMLDRANLYGEAVGRFVEHVELQGSFDLMIADPPYNNFQAEEIQKLVIFLKTGGVLALSYPKDRPVDLNGMKLISRHNYAAAGIALYRKT